MLFNKEGKLNFHTLSVLSKGYICLINNQSRIWIKKPHIAELLKRDIVAIIRIRTIKPKTKKSMSRVNAYRCDYCNAIKDESEVSGISSVKDIFDPLESHKSCPCNESEIHFCLECYRKEVLNATANMTYRGKGQSDEDKYNKTLKEMTYAFKQAIFYKVSQLKKKPVSPAKKKWF